MSLKLRLNEWQYWQGSTRIWQKMTKYKKNSTVIFTQYKIIILNTMSVVVEKKKCERVLE